MNAYPLMNSEAVYDGQRSVAPDQRVFILTRSGFAGIQRYANGHVVWRHHVDIPDAPQADRRRPRLLDLWNAVLDDGHGRLHDGAAAGQGVRRRRARRMAGAERAVVPVQHLLPHPPLHGTDRPREMWNIGEETTPVYQTMLKFDRLRYALFPYIYSIAARGHARRLHDDASAGHGFPQRPKGAQRHGSVHVRPGVAGQPGDGIQGADAGASTCRQARTGTTSGPAAATSGGQTITSMRRTIGFRSSCASGSIVPVGPDQQYIGEKTREAVTLYVYTGRRRQFSAL